MNDKYLPKDGIRRIINKVLLVEEGETVTLPSDFLNVLNSIDFHGKKKKIETSYRLKFNDFGIGDPEQTYFKGPIYEGEGVLVGEIICHNIDEPIDLAGYKGCDGMSYGFKLWLLPDNRLSLHLFSSESRMEGESSDSAPYTYLGPEVTHTIYETPFKRTVKLV